MSKTEDTLKAQATRLLERKRQADEAAARKAEEERLEEERRGRIASAGRTAAFRLAAMLQGLGVEPLGLVVRYLRTPGGPPARPDTARDVFVGIGDTGALGFVRHLSPLEVEAAAASPGFLARFGVGWSHDGREFWLVHDGDRIAYEVAAGIILDLLERRMA